MTGRWWSAGAGLGLCVSKTGWCGGLCRVTGGCVSSGVHEWRGLGAAVAALLQHWRTQLKARWPPPSRRQPGLGSTVRGACAASVHAAGSLCCLLSDGSHFRGGQASHGGQQGGACMGSGSSSQNGIGSSTAIWSNLMPCGPRMPPCKTCTPRQVSSASTCTACTAAPSPQVAVTAGSMKPPMPCKQKDMSVHEFAVLQHARLFSWSVLHPTHLCMALLCCTPAQRPHSAPSLKQSLYPAHMVEHCAQPQQVADGGGHEAQVERARNGAAQELVLRLVLQKKATTYSPSHACHRMPGVGINLSARGPNHPAGQDSGRWHRPPPLMPHTVPHWGLFAHASTGPTFSV